MLPRTANEPDVSSTPDEGWRAWWAAAAALSLGYAIYVGRGGPGPIPFAFLTVAIVAATIAIMARTPPRMGSGSGVRRLLGFGLAVELALLSVWPLTNPLLLPRPDAYWPFWLGLAGAAVVAAAPIIGLLRRDWVRLCSLVAIHAALATWVIVVAPDPFIDVWVMQVEGAQALVEGVNPYLPIYENLHGADSPYYGPGLVEDGQLTIGFPYPPLSLVLVLPAQLLGGDVRFAHLAGVELSVLAMAAAGAGRLGVPAALLYLFAPWTFFLVAGGWTEPLVVLLVAVVVLVARHAPHLLGVAVGLMVAVKQYLLVGLPMALLLLARNTHGRWRLAGQSLAVAVGLSLPFVAWDPGAFAWSTVGSLAGQIFRPDSLSYLVLLPGDWGPRLSFLGFALLIPFGALAWWRAPRTPFGFAGGLGLLLLVFFAFSRQGSANYHFAVIGILCCAAAAARWQPGVSRR